MYVFDVGSEGQYCDTRQSGSRNTSLFHQRRCYAAQHYWTCSVSLVYSWFFCVCLMMCLFFVYPTYCLLSDDAVWRLSVCLSVWRLSVAYIRPKSSTERPRKTKIGTEVSHATRDSDTTFKIKRSKVKVIRPLYSVFFTYTVQCIVMGPVCLCVAECVCLWVGVFVGGWVCYHSNSKLRASILTKLGLYVR